VKARTSSMDDVPTGQPALALAQKVIARVTQAGLPADLVPAAITSVAITADSDAENELRTAVLEFMDTVRRVEADVAAGRRGEDVAEALDVTPLGTITADEWRDYWPAKDFPAEPEPEADDRTTD
jgi:nucleoside triphosphate diphosphatase